MNARTEYDANKALAATPRGLSCTAWRKSSGALTLSVRWQFWLALSLTAILAVGFVL